MAAYETSLSKLSDRRQRSLDPRQRHGQHGRSLTRSLLDSQRLGERAYSLSALQKFSACPYQFLLSAIYRLQPAEEPEPLQKLDPLTRGSIFHEAQAQFFRALQKEGLLGRQI